MKKMLIILGVFLIFSSCTKEEDSELTVVVEERSPVAWKSGFQDKRELISIGFVNPANNIIGTKWEIKRLWSGFAGLTESEGDVFDFHDYNLYSIERNGETFGPYQYTLYSTSSAPGALVLTLHECPSFGTSGWFSTTISVSSIDFGRFSPMIFTNILVNPNHVVGKAEMIKIN